MKNIKEFETRIEGKEWESALDNAFKNKKKDIKVDGFRKGAVPKDVYIKKFGIESLYMDAVDECINLAYQKLIKDNDLKPVCEPKVDVAHICESCIDFKFTVIERPEIKLGKYKKLGIKKENPNVTAEDINKEINQLRQKYADVTEDNTGKVEIGSTAVIDFKGIVDGKVLEGGTGENYPLEIGSNTFIPGFEDGLVGMKVGDEKVLNLQFPDEYVDNLKGKPVEFTVTIKNIKKRVLPELGPDFYKDLGYDKIKTQTEFENEISKRLLEQKQATADNKYVDDLLKVACDNMEVEINPEIIEDEVNRILNQYRQELQMQGLTLEQYLEFTKGSLESLKKMMEPEAITRTKARYLLEEIVEKENIEISDEDMETEIKKLTEMYNTTEDELLKMLGSKEFVKYDLKMRKAIDILKEN